jgi:hypothetical protein
MRWLATLILSMLVLGQSGPASAGEVVQNFASELMLHESRQVLRPDRVVRYSDPEGGTALRALLAPSRTTMVLDEYFSELLKASAPPDIHKLVEPLVKRYEKAFIADPRTYEEEYLDSLNVVVGILERTAQRSQLRPPNALAATGAEAETMRKLLDSLQGLSDSMITLVAQTIREKANSGIHSAAGKTRALALADRLTASVRPVPSPPPVFPDRPAAPLMAPLPMRGVAVTPEDIEDTFRRYPLVSAEALAQMQQCEARTSRTQYDQLVADARRGLSGVNMVSVSDGATMIVVVGMYWTCVKLGPTGYPVLPVEALRNTVTTVGAGNAALSSWRRKMLADLAMTGKSSGLVGMSTGYASSVVYTLSRSPSTSLAYDVKQLQPGTYNRADYNAVLLEPGITNTVVFKVGGEEAKNGAALFAPVGRLPLTADGFVDIPGSTRTGSTDFAGSEWRSEAVQGPGGTLRLDPQGVAYLRSPVASLTGQWKVTGNVLQVLLDADVRYSLALSDDGRFLDGDIRRKELPRPNFPGASVPARHDDAEDDLRFKSPRFYRPTDIAYEQVIAAKREDAKHASIQAARNLVGMAEQRRVQILRETPQQEADEQEKFSRANKVPTAWRVCDSNLHTQLIFSTMRANSSYELDGRSVGEICYSWVGTRKDWKSTILQDGCKGRCAKF